MAVERDSTRDTLPPEPGEPSAAAEVTTDRPARIDRYEIRHELGRGAMGSVFAAWDPKLCREVAIKFVASKQRNHSKGRARFLREARAIAAIGQANVVQIFDYSGLDSSDLYLVMEKLEGRDLWELMHTHRHFPEAIAALIGHELCLALEAAHRVGIIHRDLKPENVFVTHAGRVVLTDFGIVKAIADDAAVEGYTERTEVIGTPGFMAPELMRGKDLTPMTDVFALGALLYNISTLAMPYEGQSPVALLQAAQKGDYVDPRRYQPSLSNAFCALIKSCLHPSPAARPPSAEAVRLQLRAILDDLAEHAFADDLLTWLAEPMTFADESHRRALAHLLDQLTVAVARGERDQALALRSRILALDPFNEQWRALLAPLVPEFAEPARVTQPALPTPHRAKRRQGRATARGSLWARVAAGAVIAASLLGVFAVDRMLINDDPALRPESLAVATSPVREERSSSQLPTASAPGAAAPSSEGSEAAPVPPARQASEKAALSAANASTLPADEVAANEAPVREASPGPQMAQASAPTPETGNLLLEVEGRGGWLIVDGHKVGHIKHHLLSLPAGRHRVVLVRRAQATLRRWVHIAAGVSERWHVPIEVAQPGEA